MVNLNSMQKHDWTLRRIRHSKQYFDTYHDLLPYLPYDVMDEVVDELLRAYNEQKTVFVFGNGGSAALASHFACDLGKGTVVSNNGKKRFRVLALTDNLPLLTAWANDFSYDEVFAQQLQTFVIPGDIAFAISGSGNSPNVLRALEVAKSAGALTIGLAGFHGGKMKPLCEKCIVLPFDNMQLIEDFHLSVCHSLFLSLCSAIRGSRASVAFGGD